MKRFNEGSFFCGICLENKKGIECFKLSRCGHVSCKVSLNIALLIQECLKDYYGMCISEGLISQVHCIDSKCALQAPPNPKSKQDLALTPCIARDSGKADVISPLSECPSSLDAKPNIYHEPRNRSTLCPSRKTEILRTHNYSNILPSRKMSTPQYPN